MDLDRRVKYKMSTFISEKCKHRITKTSFMETFIGNGTKLRENTKIKIKSNGNHNGSEGRREYISWPGFILHCIGESK